VQDDEPVEETRLADPPRLVAMAAVVRVEQDGRGRVHSGDGQRDVGRQDGIVDVCRNGNRVPEAQMVGRGRRQRRRGCVWGELEDRPRGELDGVETGAGAGHGERMELRRWWTDDDGGQWLDGWAGTGVEQ